MMDTTNRRGVCSPQFLEKPERKETILNSITSKYWNYIKTKEMRDEIENELATHH